MGRRATIRASVFPHCRQRAKPAFPKGRHSLRHSPAHDVSPRLMSLLTCRQGRLTLESIYLTVPIGNYARSPAALLIVADGNLLSILFWHSSRDAG